MSARSSRGREMPYFWLRRLTLHKLVYLLSDDRIEFLQARYHYR